nr:alpha/beta hydrolase-fold protein [uncultured Mediterraneibacter sp.]
MKNFRPFLCILIIILLVSGCRSLSSDRQTVGDAEGPEETADEVTTMNDNVITSSALTETLETIPGNYTSPSDKPGTLVELEYDTYESMTYDRGDISLHKRAIVYLPYGYSQDTEYNVFYLMHGGWSDETTYLGTPDRPNVFKNVLDHAMSDGKILPMIVVCPTYNNESSTDSSDYSLAIRLTENYHNELINDLIPAVEETYSTYAQTTDPEGLKLSRDHRAFCGFSMGSVATWRTFQYCLDYFRYFMPSSGSLTSDGEYMADIVQNSGYEWTDFFIFAASGTNDFAYSAFKNQIMAMAEVNDGTFRYADNEREGNLCFLEHEGGTHSGEYAMEYFYNGLCWIWK